MSYRKEHFWAICFLRLLKDWWGHRGFFYFDSPPPPASVTLYGGLWFLCCQNLGWGQPFLVSLNIRYNLIQTNIQKHLAQTSNYNLRMTLICCRLHGLNIGLNCRLSCFFPILLLKQYLQCFFWWRFLKKDCLRSSILIYVLLRREFAFSFLISPKQKT